MPSRQWRLTAEWKTKLWKFGVLYSISSVPQQSIAVSVS
ncbi:hypothetical protein EGR_11283 [Echinococcus granulosus]|uniref:Uncharacterized protein n=1 Tax=Echinococcus granulosus TaxID=6210 RepID=W6U077_ECHGR|nr:hypothetical protein EGR_11283 [Echinococcus granulosus]EUB53866.1 hypothetical protein EGR_11283 [Echinococcus granulosus]